MSDAHSLLIFTAASLGMIHTLIGPDHYLPFIVMARSQGWSYSKTMLITVLSGLGHVLGSVLLGAIGIAAGVVLGSLESLEAFRGDIASWALLIFGFTYMAWGIRKGLKNRPHVHVHIHDDGQPHEHTHTHSDSHAHTHTEKGNITPWILFTVFVFGPCEVLIPVLMYPAAEKNYFLVFIVALVFSVTTIATMSVLVTTGILGLKRLNFGRFERYSHALAGFAIFACGFAMQFLGL